MNRAIWEASIARTIATLLLFLSRLPLTLMIENQMQVVEYGFAKMISCSAPTTIDHRQTQIQKEMFSRDRSRPSSTIVALIRLLAAIKNASAQTF